MYAKSSTATPRTPRVEPSRRSALATDLARRATQRRRRPHPPLPISLSFASASASLNVSLELHFELEDTGIRVVACLSRYYSQPNPPSHIPSPANAFPTPSVSARGVVPLVDVDVECALCVHGTLHADYEQRRTLEACIRELQVSWLWRWDGGSAGGGEIVALGLGLGGGAGGSAPAIRTFASAPAPASAMGG
ncbi:hypothetical protein EYR38_001974 [Pleurotus pulmonarius]|nr:hypothetical protein EYR38_001974 [Pleurotus pulmonarius]